MYIRNLSLTTEFCRMKSEGKQMGDILQVLILHIFLFVVVDDEVFSRIGSSVGCRGR
jgi:hypothetical protein